MAIGKNFCIAPFTQITYGPLNSASPCAYLGGDSWRFDDKSTLKDIWLSPEYEMLRDSFKDNLKDIKCTRCWNEEDHSKQSARKIHLVSFKYKDNMIDCVNGNYKLGPRQINLRVGNICNLRCRPCNSQSSVTYAVEGKHYEKTNNLSQTFYTKYSSPFEFTDIQIDNIFSMSKNLRKIQFYGGEPLLDKPTLRLLEKLIDSGQSKHITLYYNTNGITVPSEKHLELWKHFEKLEFNFSIDAIGDQFTYIRHPGKWQELLDNVRFINNDLSNQINIPVENTIICTVQTLNVFYLPEIIEFFEHLKLSYFLNLVTSPKYYDIRNIPTEVKNHVIEKLSTLHQNAQIVSIISILKTDYDPKIWQEFVFWTKQKDAYRKESLDKTFPEFYELIKNHY